MKEKNKIEMVKTIIQNSDEFEIQFTKKDGTRQEIPTIPHMTCAKVRSKVRSKEDSENGVERKLENPIQKNSSMFMRWIHLIKTQLVNLKRLI